MSTTGPGRRAAHLRAVTTQVPSPAPARVLVERDSGAVAASNGETPPAYAGLVTRTIAFALDVAIVEAAAALVGVTVGLGLSILAIPGWLRTAVGAVLAVLWVVWSVAYFVLFWSTTGQTPGNRVMGIRVVDSRGRGPLKPRRAAVRFGGICLAAIPLLAGFVMMLWDDRARCLQDRIARTVVIYTESAPPPAGVVGRDLAARTRPPRSS